MLMAAITPAALHRHGRSHGNCCGAMAFAMAFPAKDEELQQCIEPCSLVARTAMVGAMATLGILWLWAMHGYANDI